MFFPVEAIISEFESLLDRLKSFDVVTIVGEGEPTLYLGLGLLIREIKARTMKPVAVITNGALLYDKGVQEDLLLADIVLPSLDAIDEVSFRKIHRPHNSLEYNKVFQGLLDFSKIYQGQLWLETMLMAGINDDEENLLKLKALLSMIRYDRLYLNTPVRPPAEPSVRMISHDTMNRAIDLLGGISIELLQSDGFHSEIKDDILAIKSIIKRHPMNQFEVEGFLKSRGCTESGQILEELRHALDVVVIYYKGYETFRLK
jgi:wyosine [tRNA(Phe)-imidazoG37] synthetase (radical SAM superfamily)